MTEIIVVNIKHSPCDVLIDRTTIFGNPFPEWKYGRVDCIKRFATYFWQRIERDPAWKAEVLKIREKGKDGVVLIGCHCKQSDREVGCHGDIYKLFLDTYDEIEEIKIRKQLTELVARIDDLATGHGWYPEELEGEAVYALSQMDNADMRLIVKSAESNPDYDIINAIQEYLLKEI